MNSFAVSFPDVPILARNAIKRLRGTQQLEACLLSLFFKKLTRKFPLNLQTIKMKTREEKKEDE